MRESTTMSAIPLPDWGTQRDCRPAKFLCDKDTPFEPDPQAESDRATTANGRSTAAKERKVRLRVSAVGFLAALVLMLVASPFVRGLKEGPLYESVLFTLVMCTGLIASGSCRKLALVLVSLPLAAIWLNQIWPQKCPALTFILPAIGFLGVVIASLLGFILRAKRVDANGTLRRHFCLPDFGIALGAGLHVRGASDSERVLVQRSRRNSDGDERVHSHLFQFYNSDDCGIWRYHPGGGCSADAGHS